MNIWPESINHTAIQRFGLDLLIPTVKHNKNTTGALNSVSVFYQSTNYNTEFLEREIQSAVN